MALTVNLGPRLEKVAEMVPVQARLADIGTDHAYLPIWLYEQGRIQQAIGVDVHEGPFLSAREAIAARKLTDKIAIRFGDGLNPLEPGEADVLTLAGMGGKTMLSILGERPEILAGVSELVLQPQGAERQVRLELLEAGWLLKDECLIAEEGRIYVVMAYSRTVGRSLVELKTEESVWIKRLTEEGSEGVFASVSHSPAEVWAAIADLVWQFGPLVLQHPNQWLHVLLSDQIVKLEKQMKQMEAARDQSIAFKMALVRLDQLILEGMKAWVSRSMQ